MDDVDFLMDLQGQWEVVRYLANPTLLTLRGQKYASIERPRAVSEHRIRGSWLIADQRGARLGNLLLKRIPLSTGEQPILPPEVEIGWHLHPDSWGHGDVTEVALRSSPRCLLVRGKPYRAVTPRQRRLKGGMPMHRHVSSRIDEVFHEFGV